VRQPLDRFILARLEKEGLAPSHEAEKSELLRRVSLDLTGMPPTPQEQAAFLADASSNAYEKQVDRLLASPRYGERWATMWLDVARYGDSKGFEKDKSRTVWPYRDWVIDAFNRNMPFDQFVIRQLAGDQFPNPSFDKRLNRIVNHWLVINGQQMLICYRSERSQSCSQASGQDDTFQARSLLVCLTEMELSR